jgi:hypothetical protein
MSDPRIIPCECCGTEGRIYVLDFNHCHETGGGWGERDIGSCEACEGTGGEIIETQPITFEDLEMMEG